MSLLAVAIVFFVLGAPFVAALEVIIYAGAVMVLFVFVIMMLNLGKAAAVKEREWLSPGMWVGPAVLSALLLAELIYILVRNVPGAATISGRAAVDSKEVGIALFGPYLLGVELASLLLLAGLVGACHLGWHTESGWGHVLSPFRIGAAMRTAEAIATRFPCITACCSPQSSSCWEWSAFW